jgi:hypothetical protein
LHAALDVQHHDVTDRSFLDLHENAPDECVPVSLAHTISPTAWCNISRVQTLSA